MPPAQLPLPPQLSLQGAIFKSERALSELFRLNATPRSITHQEIIWESESEEGAVAVRSSVFLAPETLSTSTFLAPTSRSETTAAEIDLTGEKLHSHLPGIRRGPFPPNSSRQFSLSLELWVALRFVDVILKRNVFPPFDLFSAPFWRRRWKATFKDIFHEIYLPVCGVSSGHERPSGTLNWRLRLEKLAQC